MNENLSPVLEIEIMLDEWIAREVDSSGLQALLVAACESAVRETMVSLGIPGTSRVQISSGIPSEWAPCLLVVSANDLALGSLPSSENRLLAVSLGRFLQPGEGGPALPTWLTDQFKTGGPGPDNPGVVYLARLAQTVLSADPSLLLGEAQTEAVQKLLSREQPSLSLDPAWLFEVLHSLLQVRISLANLPKVAGALEPNQKSSPVYAAEAAVTTLLPLTLGLQVPRWLLEAYTLADEQRAAAQPDGAQASDTPFESFHKVEEEFFSFLGLNIPPLEFEVNDSKEQSFAFRIQNLASPSWPALPPEMALVDAPPEQLKVWGVEGAPALSPEDGRVCSLVNAADAAHLTENGFLVLSGMHYLALSLSSQLSADRAALVHNQAVETWLTKLNDYSPELVKAIRAEYAGEMEAVVTRALRRLVEQGVSMNRLPQILEGLLDARVLPANPETHVILGDGMPVSAQVAASEWRSDPQVLADYVLWYIN